MGIKKKSAAEDEQNVNFVYTCAQVTDSNATHFLFHPNILNFHHKLMLHYLWKMKVDPFCLQMLRNGCIVPHFSTFYLNARSVFGGAVVGKMKG